MNKRFFLTASIAGILLALPVALFVFNIGVFSSDSQMASDITWGMILLGVAMLGLAGVIYAPMTVSSVVREIRRQA